MEFDKSKVYTSLNADESLIGAKGYFANDIHDIICNCENELHHTYGKVLKVNKYAINGIQEDEISIKWNCDFNFFYLVEPAPEKWYVLQDKVSGIYCVPTKCPLAPDTCKCVCTGSLDECNKYIEEHSKPKYRPFKDCDELIKTYLGKLNGYYDVAECPLDIPTILVKSKTKNVTSMITDFDRGTKFVKDSVAFSYGSADMDYLFGNYTFLDGSVCGVEE